MLEVSAGSLPRANKIHTDSVRGNGTKTEPKSRRYPYDFYVMMNQEFAKKAIKNDELWKSIRHHREKSKCFRLPLAEFRSLDMSLTELQLENRQNIMLISLLRAL